MKLRSALLASAMMALPLAAANAQAVDGLYIGGGVGVNKMQRESIKLGAPAGVSGDVRANLGPIVSLSLGWGFGNGLRAEIEASYRQTNGFNNPQGYGVPASAGGHEQKIGGMVNVLYDFVGLVPMMQPYIGAGIGYQDVIWQNMNIVPLGGGGAFAKNTSRGSLAYQAILGVAVPVDAVPGLAITAEYRFMGLAGTRDYPISPPQSFR